jgi:hypothetical protein
MTKRCRWRKRWAFRLELIQVVEGTRRVPNWTSGVAKRWPRGRGRPASEMGLSAREMATPIQRRVELMFGTRRVPTTNRSLTVPTRGHHALRPRDGTNTWSRRRKDLSRGQRAACEDAARSGHSLFESPKSRTKMRFGRESWPYAMSGRAAAGPCLDFVTRHVLEARGRGVTAA